MRLDKKVLYPLLKLAYPVMAGNVGLVLMGLTDNAMVGKVGYVALASAGIANIIFFIATVIAIGTIMVYSAYIASSLIDKQKNHVQTINGTLLISFILLIFTLGILLLLRFNFHWFQQPQAVEKLAVPYFDLLILSVVPLLIYSAYKNIADGHSITLPAMFATLTALVLNVFLNWVFIYGNLGMPALGLNGAGYATLISRSYMAVIMILYIQFSVKIDYSLSQIKSSFNNSEVIHLLRKGLPSGLQFFYEITAFAAAGIMAGWIGAKELASHQIAMSLAAFTYMIANGFSVGAMIKTGSLNSQLNAKQEIKEVGNQAIVFTTGLMLFFALVFIFLRYPLVELFTDDASVINIAVRLLIVAAIFQLFDGIQVVMLGLLRGIGDTKIPSRITLVSYWFVAIPLSYCLGLLTPMGMLGIWVGLSVGLALVALFLLLRFNKITRHEEAIIT